MAGRKCFVCFQEKYKSGRLTSEVGLFLSKDMQQILRIAIQTKGRLNEGSIRLMEEAGINLVIGRRNLVSPARNFPVEVLYLRDDDIPQTVAYGAADVGIVGENEVLEKREDVEIIKRLGFSNCRLSLAIPQQISYDGKHWFNGKKIATSYPEILSDWLKENGIESEIHVIKGSVEISPGIGLADAIFDIVSSGSTLVSNRLKEVETVITSEAVLISNKTLNQEKLEILEEFIFRLESVMRAEGRKYILLNAPNEKIPEISAILPGMKSPTIMPLAQPGWSSVHSVISDRDFWEVIGKLKKTGAEGILVIPIEKMIF
jgi:ATP phosphoribosyltransferase